MGLLNFFKKSKKEKIAPKKLTFSEIESWIEKKKMENEVKETEVLILIKDKIKKFNTDLKTKIILLDEFDIESKKAENRIKGIVRNSRTQYIEMVNNLMFNLENFKETKLSDAVTKIDKTFFDFNKASFKNYERATILIGKEMADIKEEFKIFSKDLLKIFNNNKEVSKLFQKIEIVQSKLNLLNITERNMTGINKTTASLNQKINQGEKENQKLLDEIEKIKQSKNYKNMLEKKEKINELKKESKDAIFALKQLIDFKALANFFHINEKQMSILKNYKEDFHTNFKEDNGKKIITLLDESKLNTNAISEKVNLIKTKKEEIINYKKEIVKDEIQKLFHGRKEITVKIDNLKIEKVKEEKRNERLKINKEELISSLEQELNKMNVEIV